MVNVTIEHMLIRPTEKKAATGQGTEEGSTGGDPMEGPPGPVILGCQYSGRLSIPPKFITSNRTWGAKKTIRAERDIALLRQMT